MVSNIKISKVLITGISGSGASYLAEYILQNFPEIEVHGISRWHSTTQNDNIKEITGKISVHEADLMDFGSTFAVIADVRPEVVFHLAAYANVRTSFISPHSFLSNNILGTVNLFEAIRLAKIDPAIQLCSTSEVYGQVDPKYVPIREDTPLNPVSPYAVSKTAQDLLGFSYFRSYSMRIIRTRMFTYINPRRTDLFATSFAKQIAWIEQGLSKELVHGNLDSVRTIIDVRDAVAAYWQAIIHCKYGEVYNIGGTATITVGDFLKKLIAMSKKTIPTRCDPVLLRPADVTLQVPCVEKFKLQTGWKQNYDIDETLDFLLSYWRKEAKKAARLREIGL
ncbi:MAG: GDP-mannose 4,6-dehydratase [Candidatus Omnitrophota bacterium]|nr:GDP-mannose 4,6-dehydratase [Candidatus Omnitrophota bacterium]